MSTTVTIQQTKDVTLDTIVVEAVRDLLLEQKIIAKIKGLPRGIVLWDGAEEYAAAGIWTNESVLARATELLNQNNVKFA